MYVYALLKLHFELGMVARNFNLGIVEAEAGGFFNLRLERRLSKNAYFCKQDNLSSTAKHHINAR